MSILICPVCGLEFEKRENSYKCRNGHSFDIAKEGYANFLSGCKKNGEFIGDNKEMAKSRRAFLEKNYYLPLAEKINLLCSDGIILDICCGEGYYTEKFASRKDRTVFGLDISKESVRLAAKRRCNADFFVANMSHIPVKTGSVDTAVHIFAPFCEKEFYRVIGKGGTLISAVAGKEHLYGLKQAVYDNPYYNDENIPVLNGFDLENVINVKYDITLNKNEDIISLFEMTPYRMRTSKKDRSKLDYIDRLDTVLDFNVLIYKK